MRIIESAEAIKRHEKAAEMVRRFKEGELSLEDFHNFILHPLVPGEGEEEVLDKLLWFDVILSLEDVAKDPDSDPTLFFKIKDLKEQYRITGISEKEDLSRLELHILSDFFWMI